MKYTERVKPDQSQYSEQYHFYYLCSSETADWSRVELLHYMYMSWPSHQEMEGLPTWHETTVRDDYNKGHYPNNKWDIL